MEEYQIIEEVTINESIFVPLVELLEMSMETIYGKNFEEWFAELKKAAVREFEFPEECDFYPEEWMPFYEDGFSPLEALMQDFENF